MTKQYRALSMIEQIELQEENAELKRKLAEASQWLLDAADEIEEWGGYAGSYFQDKHNLDGTVYLFRKRAAMLAAAPAVSRCGEKWTCHAYSKIEIASKMLIGVGPDRLAYFMDTGEYVGICPHKDDLIYMAEVKDEPQQTCNSRTNRPCTRVEDMGTDTE